VISGAVRRFLALLLTATLGASAARAAEPACEDVAPAVEAWHDEAPGDGCGDCDSGCADCACCRAPLAVAPHAARPAPLVRWAGVTSARATLEGVRPPSDIFQPPRA